MFRLELPAGHSAELSWISSVILERRLGLALATREVDAGDYVLRCSGKKLVLNNDFFLRRSRNRELAAAMPDTPLNQWVLDETDLSMCLVKRSIPVLYGRPGFSIDSRGNGRLELDVLGSAFFMLSRFEEVVLPQRDEHDRFPAAASTASKAGFLDRPIVDEYVEILWAAIKRIWPEAERKTCVFNVSVSHDIDSPSYFAFTPWKQLLRRAAGDFLKRRSPYDAANNIRMKLISRRSIHIADPYNTFDWIMDNSERLGLTSTFYVICGRSHPIFDPNYDVGHPAIRALLRNIRDRKHSIGLHASYNTYQSAEMLLAEANRLRKICAEEEIDIGELACRMHYLRWQTPTTVLKLQRAGISVDSTLSFADSAGFRCGTCHEYQAFDPIGCQEVDVLIHPLIAMESSVIDERYMGLAISDAARDTLVALKNACRTVNGTFSLLWHNTQLVNEDQRSLYSSILAE